ncbi:MAG: glycosyltransferase family 4 protein [Flavobacteriaceae bacterium]
MKNKICFVIPSLNSGGAERVVSNLANVLINDYEVHIITLSASQPFYKLDNKICLHYCKTNIKPSTSILAATVNNISLTKKIIEISRENKIQLLIGFMTTANILAIISSKFLGIPVIISERNNPSMEITSKMWKTLRKYLYRLANYVVVQTKPIKDYYIKTVKEDNLIIIPNPLIINLPSKQISNDNIILNVGRLSPQKAQDILIRAFALTQNKDWKLFIVGEGENRGKLEKLINQLNLKEQVKLIGQINDITQIYAQAKIFAFSSIYEGFPNALIEAMYCGLPCISTNCPTGPGELINDGVNGFLSPVNEIETFAFKLNTLMHNETLRNTFANKSTETALPFDYIKVTEKWKLLISNCI